MAPSANRRSGNSRRAQYTTFFGYIAGGVGAALGAILVVISINNPGFMAGLRGFGSEAVAPASRPVAAAKTESHGLFEVITGYIAAGSQNARLKQQLAHARARLITADAQAEENRRLKALLGLMQATPRPLTTARLIGSTMSSTRRMATLDAGSRDGVIVGMPVRSPAGLVGRVLEVAPTTSRVLLITDAESVVPVRRAYDGLPAYAQGRADGTVQIRLISLGVNPLKPGDTFVTSGSGGLYRPGTPIGVVWRITNDGAIARILSDPANSDYVIVEQAWLAETTGKTTAPPASPDAPSAAGASAQ
ncbi:MAG: rod shape-determining protein MreC [Novosphingobium sp.]